MLQVEILDMLLFKNELEGERNANYGFSSECLPSGDILRN